MMFPVACVEQHRHLVGSKEDEIDSHIDGE